MVDFERFLDVRNLTSKLCLFNDLVTTSFFRICLDVVNPTIIWRHYKLVLTTFLRRCGSDHNKTSLPRQFSDHDITILPPAPWYKYFITKGLRHQNITHCHKRAIPKPIYIVKITSFQHHSGYARWSQYSRYAFHYYVIYKLGTDHCNSYSTNSPDIERELQYMFAIIFIQRCIHRFGSYDLWHNFPVHFMKYPHNLSNNTRPSGHNM